MKCKSLLSTNRKSHTGFRSVSKLVTLNDLERVNDRRSALSLRQLRFPFLLDKKRHLARLDVSPPPPIFVIITLHWCVPHKRHLFVFISEHELMFMFAICRRPSVCRLSSETLVHPTQAIEIFSNISTPFGTLVIPDLSVKILRRLSQETLRLRLNARGVAKI